MCSEQKPLPPYDFRAGKGIRYIVNTALEAAKPARIYDLGQNKWKT